MTHIGTGNYAICLHLLQMGFDLYETSTGYDGLAEATASALHPMLVDSV